MATRPAQPITLRKINRDSRFKMAKLAVLKFRSLPLREIEEQAKTKLIDILYRDATAIPKKEIEVLRKHRFVREISGFTPPLELTVQEEGEREFKRPDGVVVKRVGGETRTIKAPRDDDYELPYFDTWNQALNIAPARRTETYGRRVDLKLPKMVELPGERSGFDNGVGFMRSESRSYKGITIDNLNTDFMSTDVMPAMKAYYVATDARIDAERRLICSVIKVIASCDTYGQVIDFWPEVTEIEGDLFGALPPAFSLVVLSDEDKAALCANMGERGVKSANCSRIAA